MPKKLTIAEILHIAADKYLWDGSGKFIDSPLDKEEFSCCAIYTVVLNNWSSLQFAGCNPLAADAMIDNGMRAMGLKPMSTKEFNDVPPGPKRQAARYAWLKFAAMIAEEQGV